MLKTALLSATAALVIATPALAQDATTPATTTTQTTTTEPTTTTPAPSTTQTTTTQPTTTPSGTPATTTQTTTTETAPTVAPDGGPAATTTQTTTTETQVAAATADDVKKDVSVFDQSGALIGKVDSVKGDAAIVNTGKARAEIPVASFGKNDKGLVVATTKAEIDAQAKTAKKPKS